MCILKIRVGDVVIINTQLGLQSRYGVLGIVAYPARIVLDGRWDILIDDPTKNGCLATYHQDDLEVIDHLEGEPVLPKISPEVIKEIKRRKIR